MTRIAFYAPLKAPTHATPSGDREFGRNLMQMMQTTGAEITLVSDLRLLDRRGDAAVQEQLTEAAQAETARLIRDMPPTDLWVTYHNYYKAPDLIGPAVCAARGIPYVQIESTRAKKRLGGPWDRFARAAHDACDAANLVFYLTEQDHFALNRDRPEGQRNAALPPFLPRADLPKQATQCGPILSVGMMRDGDKLASYEVIAETLRHMDGDWHLQIAGDGPARAQVETLMAPFAARVHFLGQLNRAALEQVYADASVFLWPGVNEAFGMVFLEAQAAGLPVAAQDRPGGRDVLAPGAYPDPAEGGAGLAQLLDTLIRDKARWPDHSARVRRYVKDQHLISSAARAFETAIAPLLENTQ